MQTALRVPSAYASAAMPEGHDTAADQNGTMSRKQKTKPKGAAQKMASDQISRTEN